MDSKILTAIENHADDNDRASEIYFETVNMDKRELADYVASHLEELRELLGIRDLATKDGAPELTKEFWDMVKLGRSIQNPDPYQKHDYYGDDLKTVDSYMEDFGVQKENGGYNDDLRAAFTNPKNPAFYGNFDRDMVKDLAQRDNLSVDEYLDKIRRTADSWQRGNQARGYNADNGITWRWFTDLGQELVFPRIREKKLAGQDASWNDWLGDLAELGLNFVPGTGLVTRATGKVVANWPKTARIMTNIGLEAAESAAVPLGSQALDIALYSDDDPRGNWDWERVGAQYAGAVGAKGAIKMGARTAKDAAELGAGKDVGGKGFRDAMDIIEDIGYDARNNIARRDIAQQRMSELSKDPRYMDIEDRTFLTPEQNKTGLFLGPEEGKGYMDFLIRKEEAERLARTQSARNKYAEAVKKGREEADELFKSAAVKDEIPSVGAIEEANKPVKEAKKALVDVGHTDKEIVQLPDGTFAYNEGGVVGGMDGKPLWKADFMGQPDDLPTKVTVLKQFDERPDPRTKTVKVGEVEQEVTEAPRDIVVRKALNDDRDFSSVASGRAKWNKPVNTGANVVFNAGAREGWVGQGLGLDEKRQAALYNQMLMKLRPLVAESGKSPEGKRRTVDAIMNVMDYGLDNLPEEMYRKDKATYKAIAAQLGSKDWSHWSENKVPDYPTTSKSTKR